jgi:2-polyprenyl-3-methyl-5-hydroxy-6-metoxy-1,4-benzoquinol methylase
VTAPGRILNELVIPRAIFRCEQLDRPLSFDRKFDLIVCTEVGEHIAETDPDFLLEPSLRMLTSCAIP